MTDRVLLLERAYQGRAMFVKVSCKAGESPVELSHHPELRFRFIPRPHDGAPLIANAVQFEARDEVELLMRRDRAGCWITMDEVLFFETCAFEIWCEKERWASGRVVRTVDEDKKKTKSVSDERDAVYKKAFEGRESESESENQIEREGEERARRLSRDAAGWTLELDASVPPLVAPRAFGPLFGDEKNAFSPQTASLSTPSPLAVPHVLSMELCLVGTCAGDHLAMTRECELAAWKVTSPRSFVSRLAMCVISEEMSSSESWSEDDSAEEEPRFETSRGEDSCATISARLGNDAFLAFAERNGANDETSAARAPPAETRRRRRRRRRRGPSSRGRATRWRSTGRRCFGTCASGTRT